MGVFWIFSNFGWIIQGACGPFERPWQSPLPPLESSKDLSIKYPSDDEENGLYSMAWRGPSCVTDLYTVTACSLLLKYFTENSVSPLPKAFVEIDDPYASKVSVASLVYYGNHKEKF